MQSFIDFVTANAGVFMVILTSVVTVASAVAQMTPNQVDDGFVAKFAKVVNFLALNWGNDKKPQA